MQLFENDLLTLLLIIGLIMIFAINLTMIWVEYFSYNWISFALQLHIKQTISVNR